jgi:hypothetical protein
MILPSLIQPAPQAGAPRCWWTACNCWVLAVWGPGGRRRTPLDSASYATLLVTEAADGTAVQPNRLAMWNAIDHTRGMPPKALFLSENQCHEAAGTKRIIRRRRFIDEPRPLC